MNSKVRGVGVGGWGQGSIQHHLGKSIHLVLTSPGVPHLHPPSPHQPWCTPSSESALCRCFCPLVLCHVLICPPPPPVFPLLPVFPLSVFSSPFPLPFFFFPPPPHLFPAAASTPTLLRPFQKYMLRSPLRESGT